MYQWLDCNINFVVIPGATSQVFIPSIGGSYAVQVTENYCIDTSSCYLVFSVGFEDFNTASEILIYPNPSNGRFWIKAPDNELIYEIYRMFGELIEKGVKRSGTNLIESTNLKSGVYYIRFIDSKKIERNYKIVIR